MASLTPEERASFRTSGYFVSRESLPASTVDPARHAVERIWRERVLRAERRRFEGQDAAWMRARPELQRLHLEDPALAAVCLDGVLAGLAAALVGPDADLMWNQAHVKAGGADPRTAVPFHQDTVYAQLDAPLTVNCWTALTTSHDDQGPVAIVPGSQEPRERPHQWDESLQFYRCEPPPPAPVAPQLSPGQVLVFDAACVHGSQPNRSTHERIGYSLSFVRAGARLRRNGEPFGDQIPVARAGAPVGDLMADLARRAPALSHAITLAHPGATLLKERRAAWPDEAIAAAYAAFVAAVAAQDRSSSLALCALLGPRGNDVLVNGDLLRSRTDPQAILRELRDLRGNLPRPVLRQLAQRALELDPSCEEARSELERHGPS